jgi:hypothetical protein
MGNSFKKPDLNAPRFREKRLGFLNKKTINEFKELKPLYSDIDDDKLKAIIRIYNRRLWEGVIEHRDGVELPNSLGYLFIGTCPPSKGGNVDFALSSKYGKSLRNKNWDTDGNIGKIFYTNWSTKYRFQNRDLWGFTATREFKRTVAKQYPKRWTRYIKMKSRFRVASLYKNRKSNGKDQ